MNVCFFPVLFGWEPVPRGFAGCLCGFCHSLFFSISLEVESSRIQPQGALMYPLGRGGWVSHLCVLLPASQSLSCCRHEVL